MIRLLAITLLFAAGAVAEQSPFQLGNAAFNKKELDESLEHYQAQVDSGRVSAALHFNLANAVDAAAHDVAALDRAHTGGRTGVDQVAGGQGEQAREIGDDFRHRPDQLIEITVLAGDAVDVEPDAGRARMADGRSGCQGRAGRRMVEGFADGPGPAGFLGLALQIAPRHIEADAIAEHVIERLILGNMRTTQADGHHQLNLVMHIAGAGRIGKVATGKNQAVGTFLEEERLFAVRVMAHFPGMVRIVPTDAIDPANRKQSIGAGDGKRRLGGAIDHVISHQEKTLKSAVPSRSIWPTRSTSQVR